MNYNIEPNGMIGVGASEHDFILGSDVYVDELPTLHTQDRKRVPVNQATGIFKQACTMMSSYSAILSLYNEEVDEILKEEIVRTAVREADYQIGKGWYLKLGVNMSCKVRNAQNPNKQVMYVRTRIGSDEFHKVLGKGYPIIMGYRTSIEYAKDLYDDGVVSIKDTKSSRGGHAIQAYKSNKGNDWCHLNTYPNRKYNTYEVVYGSELKSNGVYMPSCYAILPTSDLGAIKKRKFWNATKILCKYTTGLMENQDNKNALQEAGLYLDKVKL